MKRFLKGLTRVYLTDCEPSRASDLSPSRLDGEYDAAPMGYSNRLPFPENVMRRFLITLPMVFILALAMGCALAKRPIDHAEYFFKKGRENILAALKDANANSAQIAAAERILERDRAAVIAAIGSLLQSHRTVFAAVATGAEAGELLQLEGEFRTTHASTLRTVGDMHAALRAAVGDALWAKARERMRERLADIYKE